MSRRSSSFSGQFAGHLVAMLESAAWAVLSLSARRILDRIEIELAHHGGQDNGRLPITYDDFVAYGIHRHSIRPAINELIVLGFLEITRAGRAGNAEFREPNLFRLTYRPSKGERGDGTHEWRRIKSEDEAMRLAKKARAEKIQSQCRKSPRSSDENRHRKTRIYSTETITTVHGAESITTFDISGKVSPAEPARVARLPQGAEASEPAGVTTGANEKANAILQTRIAERIGEHGWAALIALPEDELNYLTNLEAEGKLGETELYRLRALGVEAAFRPPSLPSL